MVGDEVSESVIDFSKSLNFIFEIWGRAIPILIDTKWHWYFYISRYRNKGKG